MIRAHLDLHVTEGEEDKLKSLLEDPETLKQVANFLANVVVPKKDESKALKVAVAGGYAHLHGGNSRTACSTCVALATLPVYQEFES